MTQDKRNEIVYALETSALLHPTFLLRQGFTQMDWQDWLRSTEKAKPVHFQRFRLEENAAYQQIIPYTVLYRGDPGKEEIYAYERLDGGEKRLISTVSIGVGGHMDLNDGGDELKGAFREFKEEVKVKGKRQSFVEFKKRLSFLGLLKNWGDDVGSVHLGILFAVDCSDWEIEDRNKKEMKGSWISLTGNKSKNAEAWAEILLNSDEFKEMIKEINGARAKQRD